MEIEKVAQSRRNREVRACAGTTKIFITPPDFPNITRNVIRTRGKNRGDIEERRAATDANGCNLCFHFRAARGRRVAEKSRLIEKIAKVAGEL